LCDVTGPSPLEPTIESVRDLLASQQEARKVYEAGAVPLQAITEPPSQEFIAGEDIEPGQSVCWQDGKLFSYPVVADRSMEPLNAGDFMLTRPGPPSNFRFDDKEVPPDDANKLTTDDQEQVSSPPVTTGLQCPPETGPAQD
jgi:hypothetical protein